MVRKCVRVSGRLALSAAISWTLIPIANADAPADAAIEATKTSTSGETPQKQLHTVPEDGMGDTKWLSGATRVVRELTTKRPKEDLVICIAGCVGKQDRVVYAQPTEYVPPKPEQTISDAAPVVPKTAPVKAEPVKAEVDKPALKPAQKPAATAAAPVPGSSTPAETPVAAPQNKAADAKPADAIKGPEPMNAGAAPASDVAAPAPAKTPAAAVPPAVAMPSELKPALSPAASAASPADMKKLEFVPSMSAPKTGPATVPAAEAVKSDVIPK